jgi:hypothetical protein
MAVIPLKDYPVETTRPVQPGVSPAAAAQPYEALADSMKKAGAAATEVATSMADQAGARAVTRDANGDVVVQQAPFIGPAADHYEHAVKTAALAEYDGDAQRQDIKLRTQFRDNPEGYLAAAGQFATEMQKKAAAAAGPEVGNSLRRVIERTTTQTYRGLLNEKESLDLRRSEATMSAGVTSATDDLTALARGGVTDPNNPDVKAAWDKYNTLQAQRVANPRLAYPQAQANFDRERLLSQLGAQGFLYHVDQTYKNAPTKAEGARAATDYAAGILTDKSLKLTQQEREGYYHKALGEVRANEALRRQDISEARQAEYQLSTASALGVKIDPDQVEGIAQLYRNAGDQAGVARLYAGFARKQLNDDFGRQPIAAQTQQLNAVRGQAAAKAAYDFFVGRGYTPAQASGIVGNLIHESGLDPGAIGDAGTSVGLAQFHNERAVALAQFAKASNRDPRDFQTQLEFIDKELRGGAAVGTANLEAADKALNLTPQERALYERHLRNLTGPGGVDNPDGSRSTLFQLSFERDGKTYNIPTVWDGKILKPDDAIKRAEKEGLDKFPSYGSEAEAEKRYQQMHDFMERDTQQFLQGRGQRGSENRAFTALQAATTPEEAAAAFVHYERPQGYDPNNLAAAHGFQSRVAQAKAVFGGQGNIDTGTPASALWLQASRARSLDTAARTQWKTLWADYEKEGIRPPDKKVNELIEAARAVRDHDLLETIGAAGDRLAAVQDAAQRSLPGQAAQIAELHRQGAEGLLQAGQQGVLKDLERRYTTITKGLSEDPIATTVANFGDRFKTPAPLDLSNPDQLAAGLAYRGRVAQFAAQNWRTGPVSALDKADFAAVNAALQNPDPAAKAQIFQAITAALPEDVRNATLAKLGESGHEQMISAAAGSLMRAAPDIAQSILRGQAAIKTDKAYVPTGGTEKVAYTEALDKALPASTFTLAGRTDPNGPMAISRGAIEARYADLSAQANDTGGKFIAARLAQAVSDVTGGVLDHNGGSLIAPARGVTQAQFDALMWGINEKDMAGVSTLAGEPITPEFLRGNAQLESIGSGRYLVRLGRDPMRPIYAYQGANTEAPTKFILDLRGRSPGTPPIPELAPAHP